MIKIEEDNRLEKRILFWAFIVYLTPIPIGLYTTHLYGAMGSIFVPITMILLMIPAYFRTKNVKNKNNKIRRENYEKI